MGGLADSLLENGVETILDWIVGGIIAISAAALTRSLVRRGQVRITAGEGLTTQSPEVFIVGMLCGLVALSCLIWGLVDPSSLKESGAETAWILLMAGFALGFLITAVYSQHVWRWDAKGLEWRGAFRSTFMAWSDLKGIGKAWDGQFFVRSKSGRTIRWTTYTLEHEALRRAIDAHLKLTG